MEGVSSEPSSGKERVEFHFPVGGLYLTYNFSLDALLRGEIIAKSKNQQQKGKIMAFTATLKIIEDNIAKITLSGELDGSTASDFKEKVEEAAATNPKRLVLMMHNLEFMASAGLRVLIFAKQKMAEGVDIYMVGVQDLVKETITKTGFDQSVYLLDEYNI